jgi:hypothetical protein
MSGEILLRTGICLLVLVLPLCLADTIFCKDIAYTVDVISLIFCICILSSLRFSHTFGDDASVGHCCIELLILYWIYTGIFIVE